MSRDELAAFAIPQAVRTLAAEGTWTTCWPTCSRTTIHDGIVVAEPNPPHGLRVRLTLPVAVVAPHGSDLPT